VGIFFLGMCTLHELEELMKRLTYDSPDLFDITCRKAQLLLQLYPHQWIRVDGLAELGALGDPQVIHSRVYHTDPHGKILIFSEGTKEDVDVDLRAMETHDGRYPMLPEDRV
tara:strand:- start:3507 stop:3842 length:336 start_codon:yes stop_codon:yes gene_type:complete